MNKVLHLFKVPHHSLDSPSTVPLFLPPHPHVVLTDGLKFSSFWEGDLTDLLYFPFLLSCLTLNISLSKESSSSQNNFPHRDTSSGLSRTYSPPACRQNPKSTQLILEAEQLLSLPLLEDNIPSSPRLVFDFQLKALSASSASPYSM